MHRTTRLAAVAAIPLTALSLCAVAQPANPAAAPGTRPDFFAHMLERFDANGDGRISLDEFLAAAATRFKSIDSQNKGRVDAADLAGSPTALARIDHRAEAIVRHLDTAGNGYATLDEFLAAARQRFARMDTNGDGKLTPGELTGARGPHGQPASAGKSGNDHAAFAQQHFAKLDSNGDGVVTEAEYLAAATAKFNQLDAAGTGKVTAAEIESSPKTQERALHVADRLIRQMDSNGDGVISQDEYLAAAKARFTHMDKNGDGYIDAAEASSGRWAHKNRGQGAG